jgi:hypothetical protein
MVILGYSLIFKEFIAFNHSMEYLDWDIQWDYLQARAAVDS